VQIETSRAAAGGFSESVAPSSLLDRGVGEGPHPPPEVRAGRQVRALHHPDRNQPLLRVNEERRSIRAGPKATEDWTRRGTTAERDPYENRKVRREEAHGHSQDYRQPDAEDRGKY